MGCTALRQTCSHTSAWLWEFCLCWKQLQAHCFSDSLKEQNPGQVLRTRITEPVLGKSGKKVLAGIEDEKQTGCRRQTVNPWPSSELLPFTQDREGTQLPSQPFWLPGTLVCHRSLLLTFLYPIPMVSSKWFYCGWIFFASTNSRELLYLQLHFLSLCSRMAMQKVGRLHAMFDGYRVVITWAAIVLFHLRWVQSLLKMFMPWASEHIHMQKNPNMYENTHTNITSQPSIRPYTQTDRHIHTHSHIQATTPTKAHTSLHPYIFPQYIYRDAHQKLGNRIYVNVCVLINTDNTVQRPTYMAICAHADTHTHSQTHKPI